MPLLGNGDIPPAAPTDVYVSAYLDRLLNVDDTAYEFQAGDPYHDLLWALTPH